ncbi:hypothetical protein AJ88_25360 [Mesorhizobium amorphae CCBAU 01583]|nr:hypothetical protein AJ88_25360 [Mesorhizobium amorphae CCBAU 01583]
MRLLDHLGHGEGLAGAGDAEQHLGAVVAVDALDEILDRRRLIACRLEIRHHLDGDAALGFFRAGRAMRRPQHAVLVEGIAGFNERGERATVAVTPLDVIVSASSSEMSSPATGLRPAAVRSLAVAAPPIEVPRAVRPGEAERSGIFFAAFGFGCCSASRSICSAQSAIEPVSGVPENSVCGASAKPPLCSGSEASRKSVNGLRRFGAPRSSCADGGVFLSGSLAMTRIWEDSAKMERAE